MVRTAFVKDAFLKREMGGYSAVDLKHCNEEMAIIGRDCKVMQTIELLRRLSEVVVNVLDALRGLHILRSVQGSIEEVSKTTISNFWDTYL